MRVEDLTIEVRNPNLQRVGQLRPEELVGFTAVLRFNAVGSWTAKLPVDHPMAEELRTPGAGVIVTLGDQVILSGPTRQVVTDQDRTDPKGTYTITGVTDSVVLEERLAYPTPTTDDVAAQTSAYDVRNGAAEDVIKGYVRANIAEDAPTARAIPQLVTEASQSRGLNVRASARFDRLLDLLEGLAEVAGLGFTIDQEASQLQFKVYEPVDRSALVRLDIDNNRLTKSSFSYAAPKATRAIVAGQGEGAARTFLEIDTTDSTEAETQWQSRVEIFVDRRDTEDPNELAQAGQELLVKDGKTLISVSISPSDDETMKFGTDWGLGDKVTCVVGPTELQAVVTEVGILITESGVFLGATVGESRFLDFETQILTQQAEAALRLSKLERK
jgi:hypothetical protein